MFGHYRSRSVSLLVSPNAMPQAAEATESYQKLNKVHLQAYRQVESNT